MIHAAILYEVILHPISRTVYIKIDHFKEHIFIITVLSFLVLQNTIKKYILKKHYIWPESLYNENPKILYFLMHK